MLVDLARFAPVARRAYECKDLHGMILRLVTAFMWPSCGGGRCDCHFAKFETRWQSTPRL
jgi:hypothetical protein